MYIYICMYMYRPILICNIEYIVIAINPLGGYKM